MDNNMEIGKRALVVKKMVCQVMFVSLNSFLPSTCMDGLKSYM